MKDFKKIRLICDENTKISEKLIDKFLLYYAAGRNNLEHAMNQKFAAYRHLDHLLKREWINRLKSQYIIHKVFKKDGLIKGFLNHSALKALDKKDREFLEFHAEHPWRFSFSIIIDNPDDCFYLMEDVFTEEEFLLYSPGVKQYLIEKQVILWFNLISYNGACWQSFGPIGAYSSFEPDDIFFFATELNPDIIDDTQLMLNVESNPLPYMMLISGANTPLVFNKKDQIVKMLSAYEVDSINTKKLTETFTTEYNEGVYRFSLKKWGTHPHFSQAYFDEKKKFLVLSSLTDRGFTALVEGLNEYGFNFSDDPFIRVNLSMFTTASDILKKQIMLSEYEDLFAKNTTPESKKGIDDLNSFMNIVLPDINAGIEPDIAAAAEIAGIDIGTAKSLVKKLQGSINKLKKDTRKK